ncbi:MAG: putative sulfate/molybdate transporter [Candidatus Lokiarchaeota archaeon]|nr:putative sulfate/molybdate transporter [Candidatus Lokiarchaeota archaeon]
MIRHSLSDDPLIKSKKKFTLRELGGAFGDWGTLIPFIIGYISIVGLNPAGIFICLGLTNIIIGIKFNLPLPVQPQKTIGTIALSQKWTPSLVISTGFGTGIIWMLLGLTKQLNKIVEKVPIIIVRGIQLGLGLILGWNAIILASENLILALISIVIILILAKYNIIPSAIVLVVLGIIIMLFTEGLNITSFFFTFPKISFYIPNLMDLLYGMIIAGIGQFFLTLTNVMIATIILARDLFPEQSETLNANNLSFNMGIMNIFSPFLGGIPLCHGSGGLAAQYAFGARTGGSMILEGIIEIILGVFFSNTLLQIFGEFPASIFGSMLLYTAFLLVRVSFKNFNKKSFLLILTTALICFVVSISVGFLIGLILYIVFKNKLK